MLAVITYPEHPEAAPVVAEVRIIDNRKRNERLRQMYGRGWSINNLARLFALGTGEVTRIVTGH